MEPEARPTLMCLVALEVRPGFFTAPALVSLELAVELHEKGYMIVGPDPHDEAALAEYERSQTYSRPHRKWFEA